MCLPSPIRREESHNVEIRTITSSTQKQPDFSRIVKMMILTTIIVTSLLALTLLGVQAGKAFAFAPKPISLTYDSNANLGYTLHTAKAVRDSGFVQLAGQFRTNKSGTTKAILELLDDSSRVIRRDSMLIPHHSITKGSLTEFKVLSKEHPYAVSCRLRFNHQE